jgi:uncharacterized protein (DUF1330 family)
MMDRHVTLVVLLFVHPGLEEEFERYEANAVRIMKRYGGSIERRVRFSRGGGDEQPDEVHLVEFPSDEAFERYRGDPELVALAEARARAVRRTIVWVARDEKP